MKIPVHLSGQGIVVRRLKEAVQAPLFFYGAQERNACGVTNSAVPIGQSGV